MAILNVDDYPPSLYRRSHVLRDAGFEVIEASTGKAALSLAREHRPGLVLLDVHLPDSHGFDICREIKRASPQTVVVHISATARSTKSRVEAMHYGADAFLTEPVENSELLRLVASLLPSRG
jgi:DNA-binding response OmpR family regulator